MSLFTALSSIAGGGFAIAQTIIEKKQDQKSEEIRLKYQAEKDIEIAKIQASSNQIIAVEKTKQSTMQQDISNNQTESERFKAIVETSSYLDKMEYQSVRIANFIIALTRPLVTFILLTLVTILSFVYETQEAFILESAFATLDYILAYWFIRRSFEKKKS